MKVIIVGAGAVGSEIAKQLIDEKHDVVLIEKDREQAAYVSNRLDCMVIQDVGNNLEVLRQAGCDGADFFIAVTDSDEVNMVACALVDSEFSVRYKVARVRSVEYSAARISERRLLGIDYIVNPGIEAARAIIQSLQYGALSDVMLFQYARFQIRTVSVTGDSVFSGKALKDLSRTMEATFLVAAVLRDNSYTIPTGQTVIRAGDTLYLIATESDFEKIFARLGKEKRELNRVVVVGGGKVGREVVGYLLKSPDSESSLKRMVSAFAQNRTRRLKLVERDYDVCQQLAEQFPEALVINADISDEGVFEEERFTHADLLVAATDNQELNIVSALYARSLGIGRTIVLLNKSSYVPVAASLGIDVAVSVKQTMVNNILTFIRRGAVTSVYSLAEGRIEIIEMTVDANSRAAGKKVLEIKLPPDSLILAVTHNDEHLIPGGEHVIHPGDHVVLIAAKEHVGKLEEVFSAP